MVTDTLNLLVECPECGAKVRFKRPPVLGQIVRCKPCQTDLEVIQRKPILLEATDTEPEWDAYNESDRVREKTKKPRRQNSIKDIDF